ncbi:hypothetical protein SAMN04487899_10842 [Segatella bryantii]|nr:hypothetical protein SAMN04487899_10842 [Segatella bryantii]
MIILSHFVLNIDLFRRIFLIVIHYTYMLDIVKIRFKIPFYSRITVKSKAQLRDCFVMHLFLERVMHGVIAQLKQLGKVRTSETYTTTLNNFMAFRDEQDVPLDFLSLRLGALNEKKNPPSVK